MKFDNIIIGGGLSGLTCGIKLAEKGRKCAIVSSGQSAIHFFSGSFDLLNKINGRDVQHPLQAIPELADTHPYKRLGIEKIEGLANRSTQFLHDAGLDFQGDASQNHFVLTPMGTMKPTWLTLRDFTRFEQFNSLPWKSAIIVNFTGFQDFHTLFIQDGLHRIGMDVKIESVSMEEFEAIRRNPSEMRSTNIAKKLEQPGIIDEFAQKVDTFGKNADVVILPAVFGLFNTTLATELKQKISSPLLLLPVIPPSVPGIRCQTQLRKKFQELGGTYLLGDNVEKGTIKDDRLRDISTNNHGDIRFEAEQFVLASGSFYSKGIIAGPNRIYEPILNLDVDAVNDRGQWFDDNIFNDQPYMHFGVKTDHKFRALIGGKPLENVYVAGSVLGGANPLKEGSGAGISLLTSLHIAEQILQ